MGGSDNFASSLSSLTINLSASNIYELAKLLKVDDVDSVTVSKTVVPQCIANFIDHHKSAGDGLVYVTYLYIEGKTDLEVAQWIYDNPNDFAQAYLNGCIVDSKVTYRVTLGLNGYLRDVSIKSNGDAKARKSSHARSALVIHEKEKAKALATIVGGNIEEVIERKGDN